MKSNLYYYNLFKEIDVPEELFMYLPEQVYEDEELERHELFDEGLFSRGKRSC